jgi:hypothetical protein
MAWDSAYTAQLASSYQGMAMNSMAYSQQIGMGGAPGMLSQQMMGGAMILEGSIDPRLNHRTVGEGPCRFTTE